MHKLGIVKRRHRQRRRIGADQREPRNCRRMHAFGRRQARHQSRQLSLLRIQVGQLDGGFGIHGNHDCGPRKITAGYRASPEPDYRHSSARLSRPGKPPLQDQARIVEELVRVQAGPRPLTLPSPKGRGVRTLFTSPLGRGRASARVRGLQPAVTLNNRSTSAAFSIRHSPIGRSSSCSPPTRLR